MSKQLGFLGEGFSCKCLLDKGYIILQRNYKTKFGEIDIIAKIADIVVFIEVKTRQTGGYGLPREAVDTRKQLNYYRLAQHFIQNNREYTDVSYRFDVIEVYVWEKKYKINHLENAF